MADRRFLLRSALDAVRDDYDYIFVDCPPSLELLTLNALCAADSLLVPLQGEYYALEGLSDLMNTVRIVRRNMNPRLQIEGVLLTMFDGRTNLAIQVAQEVKRGQIVIPKEARQFYDIRPGDTVLVLGSGESGLVLSKPEVLDRVARQILEDVGRNEEK